MFVLHDVLGHPYDLVAEAVGRREDACRQAISRARQHVTVTLRIDTPIEVDYYRSGGILPFVLRQLLA